MLSRRDLLNALWLSPAFYLPTGNTRKTVLLLKTRLAGYMYYHADKVFVYLRLRDDLELRREPNNPYDHKAVEVYWRGHKLGYIPREDNSVIAQLMDRGEHLKAYVSEVRNTANYWERLWIDVYLLV